MKRILMVALLAFAMTVLAAPGDIELRAYTPFVPDPSLSIGGGVAVQFLTVPDSWPLLPQHGLFVDALYIDGAGVLGVSTSLRDMAVDDGFRAWFAVVSFERAEWACGLSTKVGNW